MFIFHCLHIDFIVSSMGAEPLNIDDLRPIMNRYDQPVVIAFDVEHHAVRANDACSRVGPYYVRGTRPVRTLDFMKPSIEGGLHRLLLSPSFQRFDKKAKGLSRDDSHRRNPQTI